MPRVRTSCAASRGFFYSHSPMNTLGGKIRFVRGSKHNQIIDVRQWSPVICFPIRRPIEAMIVHGPFVPDDFRIRTEDYVLTAMRFGEHCHYFEYVLSGREPDEDMREWRIGNWMLKKAHDAFLGVAGRLSHVLDKYR